MDIKNPSITQLTRVDWYKKLKTKNNTHTKNENKKLGHKEVQMNGIVKYEGQEMTRSVSLMPQRQIFLTNIFQKVFFM